MAAKENSGDANAPRRGAATTEDRAAAKQRAAFAHIERLRLERLLHDVCESLGVERESPTRVPGVVARNATLSDFQRL